jgi:NADPH-dependent 2,4-dienoyl-CoA reductase/sulfur reductase-like enzyme
MSAAAKAKRIDTELEAVVYEKSPYISYAACGMPYYIAGDIPDHRSLFARTPEQMAKQGVQVRLRHEVTSLDPQAQVVRVRSLDDDREFEERYDSLVIATGARPIQPNLPGTDLENVFLLRSFTEGLGLRRFVEESHPRQAVIIGGGYVGVEMAETFRRLGLQVKMVIRSGKVMRATLDDDVRALLEDEFERQEVDIIEGQPVSLEGKTQVETVVTENGQYGCDLVLLGMGVRPETDLAQAAGVKLGDTGAISTDEHMRTNLPDVYSAGDCAEAFHLVTGQPDYIPLGSTANKQGRVAGSNAAGNDSSFSGIVGTMVVRAFDLVIASTGLTAKRAQDLGYQVRAPMIRAKDSSHYFPGAADIHVKLVVDDNTKQLLGAQIVGQKGVAKRIDVLATALHFEMGVSDIQRLDLSYAPPFAPVWDPILVAANVAAK